MIDDFKIGDKVLLYNRYNRKITTVEKITPKGFIKVNGILFNKNGIERTSDVFNVYHIKKLQLIEK